MAPLSWFAGVHKKGETIFAENNWVLGLSLEKKIFISTDWWSFKATEISFFNLMLYDLWKRFQQEIEHLQHKLFSNFVSKCYITVFFALNLDSSGNQAEGSFLNYSVLSDSHFSYSFMHHKN